MAEAELASDLFVSLIDSVQTNMATFAIKRRQLAPRAIDEANDWTR